ncbi:hypothetical protein [Laspinema olomoucense]|uniref:Uncharacterized protein n=1 Tax=Laspinema olomoucense D3b TaxID=2953688 RepID=A0ABT2N7U6_9CYAN|nr:hypothetical protein [Laspinema sp. D3b]MCT7978778.1 hypothetical protein [Laspinema sp. D3b]
MAQTQQRSNAESLFYFDKLNPIKLLRDGSELAPNPGVTTCVLPAYYLPSVEQITF